MGVGSNSRKYHLIEFSNQAEAAAFIAALSRFLNYPQGREFRNQSSEIEVWFQSLAQAPSLRVYLSDRALQAAQTAFSPVPVTAAIERARLSGDCILVFGGDRIPSWGLEEAQHYLADHTNE